MKAQIGTVALLAALAGIALDGAAQQVAPLVEDIKPKHEGLEKKREITFLEDRDQDYMVTKVYEIKNMLAADLRPFVEGAVRRADAESSVSRLNYKFGKKQFLQVNMPYWMVPHIDDMIAKLDRPGEKGADGCAIAGTGVYRMSYLPQYRSSETIRAAIAGRFGGGDDIQFRDGPSNLFYWKGSYSDSEDVAKWLAALDRPAPQLKLTLNVYEINDGDLMELGIDYLAWKNGPGADIFHGGWDFMSLQDFNDIGNILQPQNFANTLNSSWAGFLIAPNIDATFVRMLNQKGKAKVATSGSLTVVNDWNNVADTFGNVSNPAAFATARYRLQLDPQYQRITKDGNQAITVANAVATPRINFYLRNPVVNFNPGADDPKNAHAAQINFGWVLSVRDTIVEQTSTGDDVANDFDFRSQMTLAVGAEKLLASYTKVHEVEQDNGIIGLSEIPLLKYLVGAEHKSKTITRVFITVTAEAANPDAVVAGWASDVVNKVDQALEAQKKP